MSDPIVPQGPAEIVQDGYDKFSNLGVTAYNQAVDFVDQLPTITVPLVSFNIAFPELGDIGAAFSKPDAPVAPDAEFAPIAPPGDVDPIAVSVPAFDSAPTFQGSRPDYAAPVFPQALSATVPNDAPTPTNVTLPATPMITLPDVPVLNPVTLPSAVITEFPTFDAVAPDVDFSVPANNFAYTDPGYSSTVLAQIQSRVATMLQGGTGLPADIEQAMFDRARSREDMTAQKAVMEAIEDWSGRGFKLPGGELARRVREAREANQDKVNSLEREILIKVHEVEIENLRFAVEQGVALETMLTGLSNSIQQRAFEVRKYTLEAAINLYNAQVTLYNSRLQVFTAKAQVFRDLVQAEVSKVELYRTQIEAAKVSNEINVQNIQIYSERVRALLSVVEVYRAQIEGVRAQAELDRSKMEVFRARVEAFSAQVTAKRTEVEAYGEAIRGELAKAQIYQTDTTAFSEMVKSYSAKIEAGLALPKFELDKQKLAMERFNALISKYNAQITGEAQRITAVTNVFRGKAELYGAELNAEQARIVADSRQFELALETGRAQTSLALESVKTNISQAQTSAQILLEAVKSAGQVSAQLASGTISAVNLSASISGSSSDSTSTSYNLSGDSPSPPAA